MANMTFDELISSLGLENSSELQKAIEETQMELPLAALRKAGGVTQAKMASRLGKSQAAVSKFEGRGDFLCSTLYSYARAIGADIRTSIRVKGLVFDLCSKEQEGNIYFSLVKRLAACQTEAPVIEIKEYVESSKRKRPSLSGEFVWEDVSRPKGHARKLANFHRLMPKADDEKLAFTA